MRSSIWSRIDVRKTFGQSGYARHCESSSNQTGPPPSLALVGAISDAGHACLRQSASSAPARKLAWSRMRSRLG
eukprot:6408917-Pyramimonas_sp.AAC.1